MNARSATLLLLILVAAGCTQVPDIADRAPWYEVPTITLEEKAHEWRAQTESQMNGQGLLLYSAWDPSTWSDGDGGLANYIDSHDVADAPAWQGRFMAAVAFEWAATGEPQDDLLTKLAAGLFAYYDITGADGLFGRSFLVDYDGPRLPWMETQEQAPEKFWKQESEGRWWCTGLAKNHFLGACLGCGIPLALDAKGKIHLKSQTKEALLAVLLPAVRRFVANGYVIVDYDGEPTEFGDLRPALIPKEYIDLIAPYVSWLGISEEDLEKLDKPLNGFNMILVLSILRAAGEYDPAIMAVYEKEAKAWAPGIKQSLAVLGFCIKKIGHWKIGKPSYSDMEAVAFAAVGHFLWEPQGLTAEAVNEGLAGLWGYMRWERNAAFSVPYKAMVDQAVALDDVQSDLQDFPLPAQKVQCASGRDDTDEVQPLCNRTMNSHYWKSSPFRRATPPHTPVMNSRGARYHYSGQDYLIAYWMGRYFGFWK